MSLVEGGMGNEYFEHLLTSVFCLATTGTGWGGRLKMALTRGCIPVIMHDVRGERMGAGGGDLSQ